MSTALERPIGDIRSRGPQPGVPRPSRRRLASVPPLARLGAAGIAAAALVLFFTVHAELWLDETLSVNIARLPLTRIPDALAHDNSAPLHYLLLHFWMEAFGTGNFAARSLSGLAGLATVPAVWFAARRVGGTWAAWTAAALFATSPFAVTYATQARMYMLVMLLTALGYLALTSVLDRMTPARVVLLALVSGLLMLTHYWSFYLLAAVVAALLVSVLRSCRATGRLWAAGSIAAGGVLMLPWLPVFLFQLGHTGTPWGDPSSYRFVLDLGEFFADTNRARWYLSAASTPGRLLGLLFVMLAGLAVLRTRTSAVQVESSGAESSGAESSGAESSGAESSGVESSGAESCEAAESGRHCLALAAVVVGTATLAVTASKLKDVSFESRYLAVVFVPFLLLVATGASLIAGRWLRIAVTVVLVLLGAIGSAANIFAERSHAPAIAAAIGRSAQPGDVVGYCPDQLAPPVDRLLEPGLRQVTFPAGSTPERVNWVDYGARVSAGFARELDRMAGAGHDVWLVWADGYGSFGDRCGAIARELGTLRPAPEQPIVLSPATNYFEPSSLLRYRPNGTGRTG